MTQAWREDAIAHEWTRNDMWADLLALPRALACAIVRSTTAAPSVIVDVGSGPGDLLGLFLDAFPGARGAWVDVSPAMLPIARENLAPFDGRVTYTLRDMTEIASIAEARGADVVMTARAAHHLDEAGLRRFYSDAVELLAPGGWLIDLDHTEESAVWTKRYAAVRGPFVKAVSQRSTHPHPYPALSPETHLSAMRDAGIAEPGIPWKAFTLCLFMGRRAREDER